MFVKNINPENQNPEDQIRISFSSEKSSERFASEKFAEDPDKRLTGNIGLQIEKIGSKKNLLRESVDTTKDFTMEKNISKKEKLSKFSITKSNIFKESIQETLKNESRVGLYTKDGKFMSFQGSDKPKV